jgi:hypothetical protein
VSSPTGRDIATAGANGLVPLSSNREGSEFFDGLTLTFRSQRLLFYVPPTLNLSNSTFSPQQYICYVRISEQTAIISLYSINCLVFITEMECVYCAVRTGSTNKIQADFSSLRQVASRRSPPRRFGFDSTSLYMRFTVGKVTLDYSSLSLSVSFRERSILIFIYMLLLIHQMWKYLHNISKVIIIIIIIIIITYLLT